MLVKYINFSTGYRCLNLKERLGLWMSIWESSASRCCLVIEMDMNAQREQSAQDRYLKNDLHVIYKRKSIDKEMMREIRANLKMLSKAVLGSLASNTGIVLCVSHLWGPLSSGRTWEHILLLTVDFKLLGPGDVFILMTTECSVPRAW